MLRVVDAETVIVPLAVAVIAGAVGFLGGDGWNRVRLTGRLRANIAAESALLKELPANVRPLMERHLEHQTRLLLAEQEWFTWSERSRRNWGALLIASSPFPLLMLSGVADGRGWTPSWFAAVGLLMSAGLIAVGGGIRAEADRSRNSRRGDRRAEVDAWKAQTDSPLLTASADADTDGDDASHH